jgi:hypothetical protein
MRKLLTGLCVGLGLLLTSVAHAQDTTSRPGLVEDSSTLGKDVLQLEGGYTFSRSGATKTHSIGEVLLRYGLNKNVELRVAGDSYQVTRTAGVRISGFQDAAVGVKLKLRTGETKVLRPRVAVLLDSTIPTGAKVFRNDYQPGVTASFGWDVDEKTGLNAAVGYRRADGGAVRFNQVTGGVQLTHQSNDRYGFLGEVYDVNSPGFGGSTKYAAGAVTYKLSKYVTLDLNGGYGLNGLDPDYFVGFGATKRF